MIPNSKVENISKYMKYSKHLTTYLITVPELKKFEATLKTYKNNLGRHISNLKSYSFPSEKLKDLDESLLKIRSTMLTATFARMMEYSEFRDEKDRITQKSISAGIEIHQDKDFMIMPDLSVSMMQVWFIICDEAREKITSCYDHMYFHALQLVIEMGGYDKFEDLQIPMTKFGSKIGGACNLAKYIMESSIESHKNIEDKSGAIDASNKIIGSLETSLQDHGIKDVKDLSVEGAIQNPELISSVNDFRTNIRTMVDSGELSKDQLVDVSLGAFQECKKIGEGMPKDTRMMLNTFAAVCREKAKKDPALRNNRHAMKFINEIVDTYYDKTLPVDQKTFRKMEKDLRNGKKDMSSLFAGIMKDLPEESQEDLKDSQENEDQYNNT